MRSALAVVCRWTKRGLFAYDRRMSSCAPMTPLVPPPSTPAAGANWQTVALHWQERAQHWEERALRAEQELQTIQAQMGALKGKIAELQQMLFGRKSEKQAAAQAVSAEEPDSESEGVGAQEPPAKRPRGQQRGAPGHGRRRRTEVRTVVVEHDLPEGERCCPRCGKPFTPMPSDETSEEIDWEVEVRRKVHRRKRYRKTCQCPQTPMFAIAPVPPKVIPKGLLSAGAISHLVIDKFLLARPTHKTLAWLKMNSGLHLPAGTVAGVMQKLHPLLAPLEEAIIARNRAAHHWHGDETRWKVYAELAGKRGCDWWLWVFASADAVAFLLDPSRSGKVPRAHFQKESEGGGSTGILNSDRLNSYGGLEGIVRAFCWAHQRRDFIKAACSFPKALKEWEEQWLERIGTLYHLHGQRKALEIGSAQFEKADRLLREHVVKMAAARDEELAQPDLHPGMAGPLLSLANRWEGLTVFLDYPWLPLDNNEAERLLRTPVLGRKNFYGSGSVWSGHLAACVFSVLGTAVKNGLNPLTYLIDYFEACAEAGGTAPECIDRFLPWSASEEQIAAWARPPPRATEESGMPCLSAEGFILPPEL